MSYQRDDYRATFDAYAAGQEPVENPVPVLRNGQVVGHFPTGTIARSVTSSNSMYDVRPGDWKDVEGGIEVSKMLGYGDMVAATGFRPLNEARAARVSAVPAPPLRLSDE